ncbi:glycosyltransferase [Candidatus Thioglobus sp. NP1]|uniref:glycosyltransferase n=1 Tax=Candidatus Thioglobus sp. NP1 TaxID=2508687 RepID=UPI000DEE0E54|nr:glycosyltransferase [Candidatus Thioglobus sp. NP1]AXE61725.1 hypothetical protein CRN91_03430 [Candidatus Thioglobus sp. NP1]
MKILKKANKNNNFIATVAIGENHFNEWQKFILPSWLLYCDKFDIGLVVFEKDLIQRSDSKWKKANWQRLLMGDKLQEINANNVCYLDTDIMINPSAPNIFELHDQEKLSVVSQTKTPYDHATVLRKIAFLRNRFLSSDYPLDSALFMNNEDYYRYHNFEPQEDIFCSGFFIFNVDKYSNILKDWFYKYPSDVDTVTNGGDEPVINFEFQNYGKINWLDYKFQALWMYEMAEKYPFLYAEMNNEDLFIKCIQASLKQNFFLHFAGKWEGNVYKNDSILDEKFLNELKNFDTYLKMPVTGKPVGPIYP